MNAKKPGATTPAARKATPSRGTAKTAAGIPIKVKPADKRKLKELADNAGIPLGAAALAAVEAGCMMIRHAEVAYRVERRGPELYLWNCINRDPADYTETVPLLEDVAGTFHEAESDAGQLGRTMADWCGTLVHVGLMALASRAAVVSMMEGWEAEIFARAAAATCTGKGGAK